MTFLLSRGKNQWALLKFQLYLVRVFGVIAIDNEKSITTDLYSAYMETITGACLIDHKS